MQPVGCAGNYGTQGDRQHLLANRPTQVQVVAQYSGAGVPNGHIPGNPAVQTVVAQADIGPNYATLSPKNTMGKMASKAPSPTHAPKEPQPIIRVNTYEDITNCEVEQRFFIGQRRIHVDSMESERGRPHDAPPPRSHDTCAQHMPRPYDEGPPEPAKKPLPQETVSNQTRAFESARPISEEFPPPPPYTETEPDPVSDNMRNAYTQRMKCV